MWVVTRLARWWRERVRIRVAPLSDAWLREHEVDAAKHRHDAWSA
jgi:hypothetical protein